MSDGKYDLRAEVRGQIIEMIGKMDLERDNKLPPEKKLAETLQVSRITVRTVLASLEEEGKVFRRHGSGTFVNAHAFNTHTTLYPQVYYGELIRRSGYTPTIEIVKVHTQTAGPLAGPLALAPEDTVVSVEKIYRASGRLAIYCIDHLSTRIATPPLREKLQSENVSIFSFLAQHTHLTIAWDIIMLEATSGRKFPPILPYLQTEDGEDKSLLLVHTTNYDRENRPLLYSESYIDTDIIKYHLMRHNFDGEGA